MAARAWAEAPQPPPSASTMCTLTVALVIDASRVEVRMDVSLHAARLRPTPSRSDLWTNMSVQMSARERAIADTPKSLGNRQPDHRPFL